MRSSPRDNNPLLLSGHLEPLFIVRVLSEVIIVNFNLESGGAKNACHFVPAELTVEKEN
ncbi:MAG TPA: hypothetical protein VGH06_05030 [Candidatus Udaeobacter sp.]|jgi:hypothetical protein